MANLIELVCECGKVLRVPKSRAGQTGRCAQCRRAVKIPESPGPGLKPGPDLEKKLDRLDKTTIRMSHFADSGTTASNLPQEGFPSEVQGNIRKATVPFAPTEPSYRIPPPFLAQEPTYTEGGFFGGERQAPSSYETAPPGNPLWTQEEARQCPRCGNMNPAEMDHCQQCGSPFYGEEPPEEAVQPEQPATRPPSFAHPRPPAPKSQVQGRRLDWLWCAISFIIGVLSGVFLGPGTLSPIPWSKFLSREEKKDAAQAREAISQPQPPATQPEPPDQPEDILVEGDPLKAYDADLYEKVEQSTKTIEAYLSVFNREYSKLEEKFEELEERAPNAKMPAKDKAAEAKKYADELQKRVARMEKYRKKKNWSELEKFYKEHVEGEKLTTINPAKCNRIKRIQEAVKEVEDFLAKIDITPQPTTPPSTKYMGEWYHKLTAEMDKIKAVGKKSPKFASDRAQKKFWDIENVLVKVVEDFAKDVNTQADLLLKLANQKNIKAWADWRRKSPTISQQKQGDLLEQFVKTKKFELKIDNSLLSLRNAVRALEEDAKDRQMEEEGVAKVVDILKEIEREYREVFEPFSSAIQSFKDWTP